MDEIEKFIEGYNIKQIALNRKRRKTFPFKIDKKWGRKEKVIYNLYVQQAVYQTTWYFIEDTELAERKSNWQEGEGRRQIIAVNGSQWQFKAQSLDNQ